MKNYYWVPGGRDLEVRILAGIFFLAFCGVVWIIIGVFKWVVSLL